MAREALKTKDDDAWSARKGNRNTARKNRRAVKQLARSKPFAEMDQSEKDQILLLAAQMLGIIRD
jgi:hypothetical protein